MLQTALWLLALQGVIGAFDTAANVVFALRHDVVRLN
jgi:hypothetical protein